MKQLGDRAGARRIPEHWRAPAASKRTLGAFAAGHARGDAEAASMTLRCVIVDDSPDVLREASRMLEGQGIAVVGVAENSVQAHSLIAELQPDVALVDVVLGRENGFDLVRGLVTTPQCGAAHAILMSTRDEADFADLIATSPAIGFVPKADLSATTIHRLVSLARNVGEDKRRGT